MNHSKAIEFAAKHIRAMKSQYQEQHGPYWRGMITDQQRKDLLEAEHTLSRLEYLQH